MNKSYQTYNHSNLMMSIEKFVEKTINARSGWVGFKQELKYLIRDFNREYDLDLKYSAYQEALYELISRVRTVEGFIDYSLIDNMQFIRIKFYLACYGGKRRNEIRGFTNSEKKNKDTLTKYLQNLIAHYSKLLFVRVDLAYLKEYQNKIDIRLFKNDIQKLIGYIQDQDTCFKDIEGYAWALEQGEEKGYHCHLLLIYNGALRQRDYHFADQVIKRWKDITEQQGYGFNCNTTEHKEQFRRYEKLGVGMIHRDNEREVVNAINTCNYLVNPEKTNQYLRVKLRNMRTFGTGSYKRSYRRYGRGLHLPVINL